MTAPNYLVMRTDEMVVGDESGRVADGTAEACVLALLELVPLEWLNRLKLYGLGEIQQRRRGVERKAEYTPG